MVWRFLELRPTPVKRLLIRFLRRRDVRLRSAPEYSEPPKERELYELPSILDPYPQLPNLRQHGGASFHSCRPEVRGSDQGLHPGGTLRADWREDSIGSCRSLGEGTG